MLLACAAGATAAHGSQSLSGGPRQPVAVSIHPDVALTAPLQPMSLTPAGSHAAFPGMTLYPGRTLTVAWRQGSDHVESRDGALITATSWDTGLTYHNPTTVLDDDADERDPSLTAVGDELWMTYFTGSSALAAEGAFVVRGSRAPVRIDHLAYAAIAAPVVVLPDGSVGAVYYGHASGKVRDSVWFARSVDGGATWTSTEIAKGAADGRDYQEPWLVVRDGTLHVTHRYGGWDSIGITSSTDGGVNWTTPRKILAKATGRPTALVFASGLMMVVYRHTDSRAAVIATSRDGGLTWRSAGTLLTPPAGSPLGMTYEVATEVIPGVAHVVVGAENADGSSTLYRGWLAESGDVR